MNRWDGKVAVVTGASSGIGAAIAEKLVQEGLIVGGFARRKEKVEQLSKKLKGSKGKLHAVKVDITKEDEIIEGFNWESQKILAVRDMKINHVNGHIIHINSIAGHKITNIPKLNIYAASKYAVTALAETLRNELVEEKLKIKITSISPGLVKTEMIETSDAAEQDFLKECPALTSEDVADAILYVLATPPHVEIPELTIRPLGETL